MHFGKIDIPDEVVKAVNAGNLVVFVGAGASVSDPVKLPGFNDLVDSIRAIVDPIERLRSRGCYQDKDGRFLGYSEPAEKYLGYLEENGKDVRSACCELLDANGEWNSLHEVIVKLFDATENLRIVTTNFDNCFESYLDVNNLKTKRYLAPALPLGDDVEGLVHLHGCVDEPNNMVLVARDYGKAYVSDGWASRFLVKLFQSYTVLFIGYSCSDSMVDYLTRSISSDIAGKAFALVKRSENEKEWESRGVNAISYSDYKELPGAIEALGEFCSQRLADRVIRLQKLAAKDWLEPDESEYLLSLLGWEDEDDREVYAQSFCSKSTCIHHLELILQSDLSSFLESKNPIGAESVLLNWAIRNFAIADGKRLQELCAARRGSLSIPFYRQLVHDLVRFDVAISVTGRWMAWIELSGYGAKDINPYALIEIARNTKEPEIVLSIVRLLLKPHLVYSKGFNGTMEVGIELPITGDYYKTMLLEAVNDNPEAIGERVFEYCVRQIEMYYSVITDCWTNPRAYDSASFGRSAIEGHEQDMFNDDGVDTLLDIARDCVTDSFRKESVKICLRSRCLLIKRLGIWLQQKEDKKGESLQFVVSEDFLEDIHLYHEVFHLIRIAYLHASDANRISFIDQVEAELHGADGDNLQHTVFNLCAFILESGSDPYIMALRDRLLTKNPALSAPDHPDFIHYSITEWVDVASDCRIGREAFTEDYLVGKLGNPTDGIFLSSSPLDVVSYPTREFPDVASDILLSFIGRDLSPVERRACSYILQSIDWNSQEIHHHNAFVILQYYLSIPDLCLDAIDSISRASINEVWVDVWTIQEIEQLLQSFSQNLSCFNGQKSAIVPSEHVDWSTVAINHPVGRYARFLAVYSGRVFNHDSYESALHSARYLLQLLGLLDSGSQTALCIASMSFANINFWYQLLPTMVDEILLPMLDFSSLYAAAAWDGLARQGGFTEECWSVIAGIWDSLFRGDFSQSLVSFPHLCRQYLSATLAYDDNSTKSERGFRCASYSVEACDSAFLQIDAWLDSITPEKRSAAWHEWLIGFCANVIQSDCEMRKILVGFYCRWIRKYQELRANVVSMLLKDEDRIPSDAIYVRSGVLNLIVEDADIPADEKAKVVALIISSRRMSAEIGEVKEAVLAIDKSGVSADAWNCLRDACARVGLIDLL